MDFWISMSLHEIRNPQIINPNITMILSCWLDFKASGEETIEDNTILYSHPSSTTYLCALRNLKHSWFHCTISSVLCWGILEDHHLYYTLEAYFSAFLPLRWCHFAWCYSYGGSLEFPSVHVFLAYTAKCLSPTLQQLPEEGHRGFQKLSQWDAKGQSTLCGQLLLTLDCPQASLGSAILKIYEISQLNKWPPAHSPWVYVECVLC